MHLITLCCSPLLLIPSSSHLVSLPIYCLVFFFSVLSHYISLWLHTGAWRSYQWIHR